MDGLDFLTIFLLLIIGGIFFIPVIVNFIATISSGFFYLLLFIIDFITEITVFLLRPFYATFNFIKRKIH